MTFLPAFQPVLADVVTVAFVVVTIIAIILGILKGVENRLNSVGQFSGERESTRAVDCPANSFYLLAVAVYLIIAEVVIPSGGTYSILAMFAVAGAVVCAWHAWWSSNPGCFWAFLGGMVVVVSASIIGRAFYV